MVLLWVQNQFMAFVSQVSQLIGGLVHVVRYPCPRGEFIGVDLCCDSQFEVNHSFVVRSLTEYDEKCEKLGFTSHSNRR